MLEIDPDTHAITTFGSYPDPLKWGGGVVAANGKIYGMPANANVADQVTSGDAPVDWIGPCAVPIANRITSYNVCYTKLLRP